jgi:hypothetical protein
MSNKLEKPITYPFREIITYGCWTKESKPWGECRYDKKKEDIKCEKCYRRDNN